MLVGEILTSLGRNRVGLKSTSGTLIRTVPKYEL